MPIRPPEAQISSRGAVGQMSSERANSRASEQPGEQPDGQSPEGADDRRQSMTGAISDQTMRSFVEGATGMRPAPSGSGIAASSA